VKELKLNIEGMHCGACVKRVTSALQGVEGVQVRDVRVGAAQVELDESATSPRELVAAIVRIGFRAQEVQP